MTEKGAQRAGDRGVQEMPTTMEFVGAGGADDTAISWRGVLFVDHDRDRIGVRDAEGRAHQIPLSDVLELLRRGSL